MPSFIQSSHWKTALELLSGAGAPPPAEVQRNRLLAVLQAFRDASPPAFTQKSEVTAAPLSPSIPASDGFQGIKASPAASQLKPASARDAEPAAPSISPTSIAKVPSAPSEPQKKPSLPTESRMREESPAASLAPPVEKAPAPSPPPLKEPAEQPPPVPAVTSVPAQAPLERKFAEAGAPPEHQTSGVSSAPAISGEKVSSAPEPPSPRAEPSPYAGRPAPQPSPPSAPTQPSSRRFGPVPHAAPISIFSVNKAKERAGAFFSSLRFKRNDPAADPVLQDLVESRAPAEEPPISARRFFAYTIPWGQRGGQPPEQPHEMPSFEPLPGARGLSQLVQAATLQAIHAASRAKAKQAQILSRYALAATEGEEQNNAQSFFSSLPWKSHPNP